MSEIRMAEVSDHLYSKAAARRIPISGTFELTPLCNFACRRLLGMTSVFYKTKLFSVFRYCFSIDNGSIL